MKHLKDIKFPVYPLKAHKEIKQGAGPVFIIDNNGEVSVIDDTNIKGTFGVRRLMLQETLTGRDMRFYKLKKSLKGLSELAHHMRRSKVRAYIDSTGYIFRYKPSTYYKLTYHRILKRINVTGLNWNIEVHGINTPLEINYTPYMAMKYAGVLATPLGNIVYELSNVEKKTGRRKL